MYPKKRKRNICVTLEEIIFKNCSICITFSSSEPFLNDLKAERPESLFLTMFRTKTKKSIYIYIYIYVCMYVCMYYKRETSVCMCCDNDKKKLRSFFWRTFVLLILYVCKWWNPQHLNSHNITNYVTILGTFYKRNK